MNGVQLVIGPDRTDLILGDLVFIAILTAITNHNSGGNFLIERHSQEIVFIGYDIEIRDVKNIIPIHGILYVYGVRIGRPAHELNVTGFLLKITLLIAKATNLTTSCIGLTGTNTANGALVNAVHNRSNPTQIISYQLGSTGLYILIFREQGFNLIDTMLEMIGLLGILLHSLS